MGKGYVDVADLRQVIAMAAEIACEREGLTDVRIHVAIANPDARGRRDVTVEVERMEHVDATEKRYDVFRGGRSWGDN